MSNNSINTAADHKASCEAAIANARYDALYDKVMKSLDKSDKLVQDTTTSLKNFDCFMDDIRKIISAGILIGFGYFMAKK